MEFKINNEFLSQLEELIKQNNAQEVKNLLHEVHYADMAEILEELDLQEAIYVFNSLDSEITA